MPEKHRLFAEQWSPERFSRWAEKIGPATAALITEVLQARRHPEQSYRSCLGILRLAKTYSDARLEAAAQRALTLGARSVRSIESILKHRLDEQPLHQAPERPLGGARVDVPAIGDSLHLVHHEVPVHEGPKPRDRPAAVAANKVCVHGSRL